MRAAAAEIHHGSRTRIIAAASGAVLVWGVSFSAMRYCMRSLHPAEFALGRYLIASACLLAMTPWFRAPPPTRREWPMVLALACSGISVYNLFLNFGISGMDTGPASFINNSSALFAALFATALLGERPSLAIWLGIATSLGGILLIAHSESAGGGLSSAAFLLLGSACCYALYSVLQKPLLASRGAFWVVCWSMWLGTAMMLPWTPALVREAAHAPPSALLWLLFVALVPTVAGFLLWSWCLSQAPVSQVSPALYAVPVVSILTAWLTLGERPSHQSLIGCGVVIVGVLIGGRGAVRGRAPALVGLSTPAPAVVPPR